MSIFYLIFIVLAVYYSFRYDRIEEYDRKKQHRLWMLCCYMICLTGFSYGLGGDKFAYMHYFEDCPTSFSEGADYIWLQFMVYGHMPLWGFLNLFAKVVFGSFYVVQLVEAAAINIAVCFIVSKYTYRYFLFLLVYFFSLQYFVFNTEVMREGMALSFALVGMHGWLSGRKWLFFLALLLLALFHPSPLVILLFPFMRMRMSWKSLGYGLLIAFLIWLLSDLILGRIMLSVAGGLGTIVHKVLFYSIKASNIFGFTRSALTYIVLPFMVMYVVVQKEQDADMRRKKEQMMAFALVLGVLVTSFTGFVRIYNATRIFYLVMLTDYIYILFRYREHFLIRLGVLACTVFFIVLLYMIPYKTTHTRYYDFFFPYTCILDEDKSVFIREVAHSEALIEEEAEDNVRKIE